LSFAEKIPLTGDFFVLRYNLDMCKETESFEPKDQRPETNLIKIFNFVYPNGSDEARQIKDQAQKSIESECSQIYQRQNSEFLGEMQKYRNEGQDALLEEIEGEVMAKLGDFDWDWKYILTRVVDTIGTQSNDNELIEWIKVVAGSHADRKKLMCGVLIEFACTAEMNRQKIKFLGDNQKIVEALNNKVIVGNRLRPDITLDMVKNINSNIKKISKDGDLSGVREAGNRIENLALERHFESMDFNQISNNSENERCLRLIMEKMIIIKEDECYLPDETMQGQVLKAAIQWMWAMVDELVRSNFASHGRETYLKRKLGSIGNLIYENSWNLSNVHMSRSGDNINPEAVERVLDFEEGEGKVSGADVLELFKTVGLI